AAGCCVCGQPVAAWRAHPHIAARSEFMKLLDAVGSDLAVYECPACHCNDRDRHLWHYMNALGLAERLGSMRILHVAPERHIEALIAAVAPRTYVRGDLHPQRQEHLRLNVESLPFDADSFDLIICNHVLEHVASPAKALAQFHRCLGPGGLLIAQTPYAPSLKHTFEKHGEVSKPFARLFYGQEDHVRLFGADIVNVFRDAGFSGEPIPHRVLLPDVSGRAHGVNEREPFFCFSK
ncbi:MAG: class I SAM-dependent methyltransferase, partial [Pseudomonadota bacterium]|nr:class I SAM-dependent methyltransferase [Pseudomonadota bacterium]